MFDIPITREWLEEKWNWKKRCHNNLSVNSRDEDPICGSFVYESGLLYLEGIPTNCIPTTQRRFIALMFALGIWNDQIEELYGYVNQRTI